MQYDSKNIDFKNEPELKKQLTFKFHRADHIGVRR